MVYVSQFFWIAFPPSTFFWNQPLVTSASSCESNRNVAALTFLCQFSLLGGELWYFVLSRDIHMAITNPFSSYQLVEWQFTVGVFSLSLLTGLILLSLGPNVFGLTSDPMIWIQNDHITEQYLLFNIWLYAIYAYSFLVVWFTRRQIRKGLQSSLKARLMLVNRAMSCKKRFHYIFCTTKIITDLFFFMKIPSVIRFSGLWCSFCRYYLAALVIRM